MVDLRVPTQPVAAYQEPDCPQRQLSAGDSGARTLFLNSLELVSALLPTPCPLNQEGSRDMQPKRGDASCPRTVSLSNCLCSRCLDLHQGPLLELNGGCLSPESGGAGPSVQAAPFSPHWKAPYRHGAESFGALSEAPGSFYRQGSPSCSDGGTVPCLLRMGGSDSSNSARGRVPPGSLCLAFLWTEYLRSPRIHMLKS